MSEMKALKSDSPDLSKLYEPFAETEISWRIQNAELSKRTGKPYATIVPYVDSRAVQRRLDEVCGQAGWQTRPHDASDKGLIIELSIKVNGEWISKSDGAEFLGEADPVKAACSRALVRAATLWGIGRYLYDSPLTFAELHVDKPNEDAQIVKIENQWYWWVPPSLHMGQEAREAVAPTRVSPGPVSTIPVPISSRAVAQGPAPVPAQTVRPRTAFKIVQPPMDPALANPTFGFTQHLRLKDHTKEEIAGLADYFKRNPSPKGKAVKEFRVIFFAYLSQIGWNLN